MKPNVLCFFTTSYPYGTGETFIHDELNYIAPRFDKVYLFHKYKSSVLREIPDNVELINIEAPKTGALKKSIKNNLLLFTFLIFYEIILSRQKKLFLTNFKYNLIHFANCFYYANQIKSKLDLDVRHHAMFYSYWFFDWNLSLSILKRRKVINHCVTRVHGFDLYEYIGKPNYLPFRKFCLQNTDKVIAISKVGEKYLKNLYPKFASKIYCSYMGTNDYGVNPIRTIGEIHVVSCSNVIEVKRTHLILEVIKHLNVPVKWTHLGDGELLDTIKLKAKGLPKFITVDFKGRLTQKEIFDFYSHTPVDVFMNTSISEGLPVSIMEAISFGIPVIATNVGGTSEIVNTQTGLLVEKEFDPNRVAKWISQLNKRSDLISYRKQIKQFWQNNFEAKENYLSYVTRYLV